MVAHTALSRGAQPSCYDFPFPCKPCLRGDSALRLPSLLPLVLLALTPLSAQWTNRYPLVKGYRHHIYLEGYELPFLGSGVLDPAPSPDGKSVYFSGSGWIWKLDLATGEALRITSGGASDTRPALSPDGLRLAFVRDDTRTLWLVLKDLVTGQEKELVRTGRLDLDPAFSTDGRALFYASSEGGDLDLWRVDLATGERRALTSEAGLELKPQPAPDGRHLLYLAKKRNGMDQVRWLDLETGTFEVLQAGPILSLTRPALSPDGQTVALALPLPGGDTYQLQALDVRDHHQNLLALAPPGRPLMPAWSSDGQWVYFCEDDGSHTFVLKRAALRGGAVEALPVRAWNWGAPTTTLTLRTLEGGRTVPARLEVLDGKGHPLFPAGTPIRFDNQNGRTYFHAQGDLTWTVPAGEVRVTATRGFGARPASAVLEARADTPARTDLVLEPLPFPEFAAWRGGDLHFHLNYGGPYRLGPQDLVSLMKAENLDVGEPMVANLQTRLTDREWLGWRKNDQAPLIEFGQEARSNLFGHLGLAAITAPFAPSFWGPDYAVIRTLDVLNADALAFARRTGALSSYVHPTPSAEPFKGGALPGGFVLDAVLGQVDALEVSGLWTQELGASELLYQVLNAGFPLLLTAGTDSFPNFSRCSVTGSNRAYAYVPGPFSLETYFAALREGRSFVSSGPLAAFRVDGALPGTVVKAMGKVGWTLDLASTLPVEHLEILVNGQVAQTLKPLAKGGAVHLQGSLELPAGGWVAFRAWDEHAQWPTMNSRLFVHTSPHWIGRKGSTDPERARAAAAVLLAALREARRDLEPRLEPGSRRRMEAQFDEAEARLRALCQRRTGTAGSMGSGPAEVGRPEAKGPVS